MAPPIDLTRFEQLKASGELPSPKGVALAIMRLTRQDEVSIAELARTIRTDPALVGRLIKAANGAIGYGRRPIVSVQDALTVLGLPTVRTMALGFSLLTHYRAGACQTFDYSRYWSASLVTAIALQAITVHTRVAIPDETYCLGLLAGVGELALATLYPKDYAKVITQSQGGGAQKLLDLESHAFAMNHAELGAAMFADWGIPRIFTDAAYLVATENEFSQPEGSRGYLLTQSLVIARQLGEVCLATEADRTLTMRRLLMAGSRLSLDEETIEQLADKVAVDWVEWGALLQVYAKKMPSFAHLRAEAKAQQHSIADAVAGRSDNRTPVIELQERDAGLESARTSRTMRVLLVDADAESRIAVRQALEEGGFDVAEARDGHSATEFALDFQPDMLIVGARVSDINGDELIKMLRQTRAGRTIYILTLGLSGDDQAIISALEGGADDMIPVPVNPRLLLAKAGVVVRLTSLKREIEQDREDIRHVASELALSNRRLQEVALVDSLTGFPNRRFFVERLNQEWAASLRNGRPIACFMLDLDHFKQINDSYGHDVGDSVLQGVAAAIRPALRTQDVVARVGGDEFIVLCPDTGIEAAISCAERVRRAVEGAQIASGALELKVTASIGVASLDTSVVNSDSLLKLADQGMYLAKQEGRNRVSSVQLGLQAHAAG